MINKKDIPFYTQKIFMMGFQRGTVHTTYETLFRLQPSDPSHVG